MNLTKYVAATVLSVALLLPDAAQAKKYDIDAGHSGIVFKITHLGMASTFGMFRKLAGTISYDAAAPAATKIDITVDAASIYTADKKRDDHLKGPDFFAVKEFPRATFVSKSVKPKGSGLDVTGDLTIRGKTKTVTVFMEKTGEGKDPWGNFRIGFEGTLIIDRMEFGVSYMPDGLGKNVTLLLSFEGVQAK